jgi:hypothetical protein
MPEYVLDNFEIVEPSRMTRDSSSSLIEHWLERLYHNQEPFRFKDQSPKLPVKRIKKTKSYDSMKMINLDSSDEDSQKETKTATTSQKDTPPSSDEDNELTPQPKPKKSTPKAIPEPRSKLSRIKRNDKLMPMPMPKLKKTAPKADDEPRPKKVLVKKVELSLPLSRDESDMSLPMMKIGPLKKAQKLPTVPKSKPTVDSSVFDSSDLEHSTLKRILPLMQYELLTNDKPLLEEDENQPIALTGPNVNCGSETSRYHFLLMLSPLKPYQTLIQSIRALPKAFISSTERKKFQPWADWDQTEHCIPENLHMDDFAYSNFLFWMMEEPYRYAGGKLMMKLASEHITLAIGMTLRDLHLRDNIHPSQTELYPSFINSSKIQLTNIEDYFVLFCEVFTHTIRSRNSDDLNNPPKALTKFKENASKPLRNSGMRAPSITEPTPEKVVKLKKDLG